MSLAELKDNAGWWPHSLAEWDKLPYAERRESSFRATGCESAYPTWPQPVNCVHVDCQVRRGELPKIAITNHMLRAEIERGWLRFHKETAEGRRLLARICRAFRRATRETGEYDIWKLDWRTLVYAGVSNP